MPAFEPVAIVGIGGLFPGARDLAGFWAGILAGADAAREAPSGRWLLPARDILDSRPGMPDKVYSANAAFLDPFTVNRDGLKLDGIPLDSLDEMHRIAVEICARAFRDAHWEDADRSKIGVILGSIALPTDRVNAWAEECLRGTGHSVDPRNAQVTGLPARLASRSLGLGLGGFTLDAACASSLYALKLACDQLQSGRATAMIAGGLSRPDSLYTQMGFAQLRALSAKGFCTPFDARADGLLVGEGGGAFALKLLRNVDERSERVYGVIRGVALSNDIAGNLLAPASEGQLRAMRPAYAMAGWAPESVGLIECHATGTPVGDAVEFASLRELWAGARGKPGQCVLGSVKSNVGHLLTGANAAGLMKVLFAFRHAKKPPTAHFKEPNPKLDYGSGPFRVLSAAEDWPPPLDGSPRRAAISGFGFGGVNAHLLVEEYRPINSAAKTSTPVADASGSVSQPIAVVGMAARFGSCSDPRRLARHFLGFEPIPTTERAGVSGHWIDSVDVPLGRYRIPPKELEEALPQQLLALLVADEALRDAGLAQTDTRLNDPRFGVVLGADLDLNTTNYHLRWKAIANGEGDLDALSPALDANRTMGGLASIAASRLARAFELGGPSITVSGNELEVAVDWLRRGDVDRVLVGSVDLPGDFRALPTIPEGEVAVEGASAFVLKKLADARRDGDRVLAVIGEILPAEAEARPNLRHSLKAESVRPLDVPRGLFGLYAGAVALHHRLLPAELSLVAQPTPWLRDAADGPRRIEGRLGKHGSISLSEGDHSEVSLDGPGEVPILLQAADLDSLLARVTDVEALVAGPAGLVEIVRQLADRLPAPAESSFRLAIAARDKDELRGQLRFVRNAFGGTTLAAGEDDLLSRDRIFFSAEPAGDATRVAFVYPGSGNQFDGMAADLAALFPEIVAEEQEANETLRGQYAADAIWQGHCAGATPRDLIFAQVSVGALTTAVVEKFGIHPAFVLGYSLGESAALFGTKVWRARDEMFARMQKSTLFTADLAPPYNAVREFLRTPEGETIDWQTCLVAASPQRVRAAIAPGQRVYVCIINGPEETVIAGPRKAVEAVVEKLAVAAIPIAGVTAAHCEVAQPITLPYRKLHHLPVQPRAGMTFFSTAWGRAYTVTSDSAADAITAGVLNTLDFPRIVEAAYAAGARLFVELAPGGSCTRMIGTILADRPHVAKAVCVPRRDNGAALVRLLACLFAEGVAIDWRPLWAKYPPPPAPAPKGLHRPVGHQPRRLRETPAPVPHPVPIITPSELRYPAGPNRENFFAGQVAALSEATRAHDSFLRISAATQNSMARLLALQNSLIGAAKFEVPIARQGKTVRIPPPIAEVPRSLDFAACTEFAVGRIGAVLGPKFAEIDRFPTRVRLPEGPLMLVDSIAEIEGEPLSLTNGRVVTEHKVTADRWYLDAGRIPTCIAVEAGQADLFLSAFLGIDLRTRGLAVYRLLDAVVTFHRPLPAVGATIRYDIRIDSFFRQGETHLFRFRFVGTVDGETLLTMTDGVAGFFSAAELAAGKGIVHTEFDRRTEVGKTPERPYNFAPLAAESFDAPKVEALRQGNLAAAFGPAFGRLKLAKPTALPSGKLKLVDRMTAIEPTGGRFGLGRIRAEMDIRPDAWFITCHFVDDPVMPGTLMYECCLHTLRILLMRMGWVGEAGEVVCEPVPGVASRLKCRGQVLGNTKVVTYEVTLREVGYRPEPYAICDALMYADGKPIVEIGTMSLRMSGLNYEKLAALWKGTEVPLPPRKPAIFDTDRIAAFAVGKPSDAFGKPYEAFDAERVIARLPGPPYQFLDRITEIRDCEPWQLKAGGTIEAQYDVPADAWYFRENRSRRMPFSILLEIALQPCGWLAGYLGSALTSPVDMSFRNLGGKGVQHAEVHPEVGALTTVVKITKVSQSAGMIIQNYEYEMAAGGRPIYSGDTYFGFFAKEALANQLGMPAAKWYQPKGDEGLAGAARLPSVAPFPGPMLRMVDTVDRLALQGGPAGLGFVQGSIAVDPSFWFFKAHFHQDPVWPGSLGLEAFLQLLKFYAAQRFGRPAGDGWQAMAPGAPHSWIYRGQVIPGHGRVTVQVLPTRADDATRTIAADGFLMVDGRIIYEMKDFTLRG